MAKSFTQAPKPPLLTPDVISAFERGGSGQDTKTCIPPIVESREATNVGNAKPASEGIDVGKSETTNVGMGEAVNTGMMESTKTGLGLPKKPAKPEPTRRLSVDLPESWHRRFKTACTKTDKKMIDEVTDFIKRRTVQLEKE